MSLEVFNNYRSSEESSIKGMCKAYRFYHVTIKMDDGRVMDGIIENVQGDNVTVLIGEDVMADKESDMMLREPPFRNRYRRYMPRNYPINRIVGLGLLGYPMVPPMYPYPYPYYPY